MNFIFQVRHFIILIIIIVSTFNCNAECISEIKTLINDNASDKKILESYEDLYLCFKTEKRTSNEIIEILLAAHVYADSVNDFSSQFKFSQLLSKELPQSVGLNKALQFFEKNNALKETALDKFEYLYSLREIGKFYEVNRNYSKANEYYLKILKIAEKLDNNNTFLTAIYNDLAGIQYYIGQLVKSKDLLQKSFSHQSKTASKEIYLRYYHNLAYLYVDLEELDSSIYYFKKCLEYSTDSDLLVEADCYLGLGDSYLDKKEYDLALEALLKSYRSKFVEVDNEHLGYSLASLTRYYIATNNLKLAKYYSDSALVIGEKYNDLELNLAVYSMKSDLTRAQLKNIKNQFTPREKLLTQLLKFEKKKNTYRDSLSLKNQKAAIIEQNLKQEFEKIDLIRVNQMKLLEKNALIQEKTFRLRITIFIFVLILLIGLIGFVIYRSRQVRIRNQLKLEKVEVELVNQKIHLQMYITNLKQSSSLLEELKEENKSLRSAQETYSEERIEALDSLSNSRILTDEDWTQFKETFKYVYPDFNNNLESKFTGLSFADKRLTMLMALDFNSVEIANAIGVTVGAVKKGKQRLGKKLGLESTTDITPLIVELKQNLSTKD